MSEAKHQQYLNLKGKICNILFYDWNPLNIPNSEYLQDEYDDHIRVIYKLVERGAVVDEFIETLKKLEFELTGESTLADDKVGEASRKLASLMVV